MTWCEYAEITSACVSRIPWNRHHPLCSKISPIWEKQINRVYLCIDDGTRNRVFRTLNYCWTLSNLSDATVNSWVFLDACFFQKKYFVPLFKRWNCLQDDNAQKIFLDYEIIMHFNSDIFSRKFFLMTCIGCDSLVCIVATKTAIRKIQIRFAYVIGRRRFYLNHYAHAR